MLYTLFNTFRLNFYLSHLHISFLFKFLSALLLYKFFTTLDMLANPRPIISIVSFAKISKATWKELFYIN